MKENNLDKQENNEKVAKVSLAMKEFHQWILNLIAETGKQAENEQLP